MSITKTRLALAGVLATAAIGSAAPAQAHHPDRPDEAERCERKYERLEARFRQLEERRGWDAASEWWNEIGWPRYYELCLAP